jgi:putative membrane protein
MVNKDKIGADMILVLCVDRDGDLEAKGRTKTPVVGREDNIQAAVGLALSDPEEADANAIFDAVKLFDNMKKRENEYNATIEVATISGSNSGGVDSDRKLASELEFLLKRFPANNVVLVSDGYSDESVLPIVESRVPIMSVKRTVVKHSETIEESWAIFFKYVRMIADDPRYSRTFLGVPGILLLALFLLWYYQQLAFTGQALLIIVGIMMFIKGFAIDQKIRSLGPRLRSSLFPGPVAQIRLFTTFAAFVLGSVGIYQAVTRILIEVPWSGDFATLMTRLPLIVGKFIIYSVDLLIIGLVVFFMGRSIYYLFIRSSKIWRNIIGAVMVLPLREVALKSSDIILNPTASPIALIEAVAFGILISVASIFIVYMLRRYILYFKKDEHAEED